MNLKFYISGKVTGIPPAAAFTFFNEAENLLKSMGLECVNPLNLINNDENWYDAMKICIRELLDCNAILMLHNYSDSKGALTELVVAKNLDYKILFMPDTNDIRVIEKFIKKSLQ